MMEQPLFELTNEQRKYLGLTPVAEHWERVALFNGFVYFDGDVIRKQLSADEQSYTERDLEELTAENRTILLPKTAKGKPKKLNYTASQSFKGIGVYFSFSESYLSISNYTTQTTFYKERFNGANLDYLKTWLNGWISESTAEDLKEIESFKNAERTHQKYNEGDFFAFKIGRRQWGFGRILFDVQKQIKVNKIDRYDHPGLTNLMGKCLIVKVYHQISDRLNIDLEELAQSLALPAQIIMDNHFYYGENPIIGNKPLKIAELDMLISYSQSINSASYDKVYLQYGMIYKELELSKFNKYLRYDDATQYCGYVENPHRNESSGFGLDLDALEACIKAKSNLPYWTSDKYYDTKFDLRNPANAEIKKEIFKAFGLDADQSYEENLKIASPNNK